MCNVAVCCMSIVPVRVRDALCVLCTFLCECANKTIFDPSAELAPLPPVMSNHDRINNTHVLRAHTSSYCIYNSIHAHLNSRLRPCDHRLRCIAYENESEPRDENEMRTRFNIEQIVQHV